MRRSSAKFSVALSSVLVLVAQLSVGAASVHAATTTLDTCDPTAFRQAVVAGGTVKFAVDCPALAVNPEIVIPSGLDITISANGHGVVLDGQRANRHFRVHGGRLAIDGVTLSGGWVVANDGTSGSPGDAGLPGAFGTFGEAGSGCAGV